MQIAIFGGSRIRAEDKAYEEAYRLTKTLTPYCEGIITGGYGGIMEACNKAAIEGKIVSIGVTCNKFDRVEVLPNEFLTKEVKTNGLLERLLWIRDNADLLIALEGQAGTLHEILTFMNLHAVGERSTPMLILKSAWGSTLEGLINKGLIDLERLEDYIHIEKKKAIKDWVKAKCSY